MDADYRLAFNMAPVGLCLSRNRAIVVRWSAEVVVLGRAADDGVSSCRASASGTAVPQKPHSALIRPIYQCDRPQPGQ